MHTDDAAGGHERGFAASGTIQLENFMLEDSYGKEKNTSFQAGKTYSLNSQYSIFYDSASFYINDMVQV